MCMNYHKPVEHVIAKLRNIPYSKPASPIVKDFLKLKGR